MGNALTEAYNAAVDALRRLHDAHSSPVVGSSRRRPPHANAPIAQCKSGPVSEVRVSRPSRDGDCDGDWVAAAGTIWLGS